MTPVAELRAARKRFGQVEALRGVDLAIGTGELVALLGPNGAGKTTSISLMLGLRRPTGGEARLFGLDPTDQRARSRCGVMLQESGTTIVLTTHYLEEADQLARRIVVIDRGVVIADATPREIKSRIPSKRISFNTGAPVSDATFRGLPVQNLEVADHRVRLLSHEPELVLKALFERGVAVRA